MLRTFWAAALVALSLGYMTQPAYAYLDPGTGSMLLQALIGGIVGGWAVLTLYWSRVKGFFANMRRGKGPEHHAGGEARK